MDLTRPQKGYTQASHGQVHWRMWGSASDSGAPDLYCLHPSPFSGIAYEDLAPLLASNRRVIAPDYPGFGGSDRMPQRATIELYAEALREIAGQLSGGAKIDLLGFHTGCSVSAEIAAAYPDLVARLCLIDAPTFEADAAAAMAAKFEKPFAIENDLESLAPAWNSTFSGRRELQGEDAAFAMFVEQLRAGTGMNDAFRAAFSYDWRPRFARIECPALVLATQSSLLEPTRLAAEAIAQAHYVERLDITRSVLNAAAAETAAEVRLFLADD